MNDLVLGAFDTSAENAGSLVLGASERRRSHALVVGAPGSGKSKLLEHIVRHDISSRDGCCVLDIHGALYQDVKRFCAYRYFLTRGVILVDPSAGEYVKGFNPFQRRAEVAVDVQVDGMVQALLRVWGAENSNQTPTLDRVFRLLFTAMVVREIPLHEAFRIINFTERRLRSEMIASFTDAPTRAAWEQLQSLKKAGEWRDEVLSTENRLFRLVSSPTVKRFMGVSDRQFNLDTRAVMNDGNVLLVNLKESANLSEDNAKAFAALLINDLFKTAIMFRDRDTLGHDPRPFYLYLDEWQNFATVDVWKILAQARKFGLLLVLANQDLAQVRRVFAPEYVDTLMTCCPVKACFGGLNRADARRMAEEMSSGDIDLNETKYDLEATRFRPEYDRDNVFGDSDFTGVGDSSFYTDRFQPALGIPSMRTGATTSRAKGRSVANVPIYRPVEFKERSSRATYSLEEQLWRWSDRLKEQPQRHCVVKLPGQPARAIVVPLVKEASVYQAIRAQYEKQIAAQNGARTAGEVDQILSAHSDVWSKTETSFTAPRRSTVDDSSAGTAIEDSESPWN